MRKPGLNCRFRPGLRYSQMRIRFLLLLSLITSARAQTVSVQLLTDATTPISFGASYPLGQTRNDSYTYGSSFIIGLSYSFPVSTTLTFNLSGAQADYLLAWTVLGSGIENAFTAALGAPASGIVGAQSNVYYRNDGTVQPFSGNATRYKIGVRATPAATQDLNTTVTLTITSN